MHTEIENISHKIDSRGIKTKKCPLSAGEYYSRCKNLALYIRDCESLCLSDETVKAVGPFYLVSMPKEGKDPTQSCVMYFIPTFWFHFKWFLKTL